MTASNSDRVPSFKLLRDFAAYQRWSNGRMGWNVLAIDRADRRDNLMRCAPTRYPCLALLQVISSGYEEEAPFFLYEDTLAAFSAKLKGAA